MKQGGIQNGVLSCYFFSKVPTFCNGAFILYIPLCIGFKGCVILFSFYYLNSLIDDTGVVLGINSEDKNMELSFSFHFKWKTMEMNLIEKKAIIPVHNMRMHIDFNHLLEILNFHWLVFVLRNTVFGGGYFCGDFLL